MHKIKTNENSKKSVRKNTKKKYNDEAVEEELSLKKIAIVIGIIAVIFVVFYLLTALILKNEKDKKKSTKDDYSNAALVTGKNEILMTDLYSKGTDKYYVIAIMDDEEEMYSLYLGNKSNAYYVNMDNALNKTIIADETVVDNDPRNIRISDTTLFVIENGELFEYTVGYDNVMEYLRGI